MEVLLLITQLLCTFQVMIFIELNPKMLYNIFNFQLCTVHYNMNT